MAWQPCRCLPSQCTLTFLTSLLICSTVLPSTLSVIPLGRKGIYSSVSSSSIAYAVYDLHYAMELIDEASALPSSAEELFRHAPLDHTRPTIRLIRILRATSPDAKIRCKISHNTTNDTYNCLSYRWGDPGQPRQSIQLNGMAFSVHQNLYDFLLRIVTRLMTEFSVPYWIDALCIDHNKVLDAIIEWNRWVAYFRSPKACTSGSESCQI